MPASFRIDTKLGVVFSVASGIVTDADLLTHQRLLACDPDFRPAMNQILDFRAATEFNLTPQGASTLIAGNPFGKGAKRACIMAGDDAFDRISTFAEWRFRPEDELRIFRSMEEAREWLGLPPETSAA